MHDEQVKSAIGDVLTGILRQAQNELQTMTQEDLEKFWFFQEQEYASPAQRTYEFFKCLELYRSQCRRWEELHHGSCCVVERVRDTYLMPKIQKFLQ
jgi:hypothetical protein